jgi:hypothetical protein
VKNYVFIFGLIIFSTVSGFAQSPTSPSEHLLFQSQKEAAAWVKTLAPMLGTQMSAKKFAVLEADSRIPRLQSYVHRVWGAYTELFPIETRGLNEPPVVLIDTEIPNAFVMATPDQTKMAHAIIVFSALLDFKASDMTEDAIYALFAHELAHSIFKHGLLKYQPKFNRFYSLSKNQNRLPYQAVRDAALDQTMSEWNAAVIYAGPFASDDLLNLPAPGWKTGIALKILFQIESEFVLTDSGPECKAAEISLRKWKSFFNQVVNDADSTMDTSNPAALRQASAAVIQNLTKCLDGKKSSFDHLFSKAFGLPEGRIGSIPEFDSHRNMAEGLLNYTAQYREIMKNAEKNISLSDVGFFTYEQHADEMSVLILSHLKQKATGIADLFKALSNPTLGFVPPKYKEQCTAQIRKGKTPSLGLLVDAHHGVCYRIYNVEKLASTVPTNKEDFVNFVETYHDLTVGN